MKKFLRKILPPPLQHFLKKCFCFTMLKLHIPLKKKKSKIAFEINIVEHCNLNCCGCSKFSCIAEPEFVSVAEFERDFARLGNIFSHECERIYLLGGEPLLHPDIITLMKIARAHFRKGDIYVFTNGILLPKKEDSFWQACHDNNIAVLISAYPIKIGIEAIRALAQKFGVKVDWAWEQNEAERDTFSFERINLKGNSDIVMNFAMCGQANNCITLSNGRLFTCSFAPAVRHFNKYFKQNIQITEADYVNIYDDVTADEILQKITEPIPACRYCDKAGPVKIIQWKRSKREISEWV